MAREICKWYRRLMRHGFNGHFDPQDWENHKWVSISTDKSILEVVYRNTYLRIVAVPRGVSGRCRYVAGAYTSVQHPSYPKTDWYLDKNKSGMKILSRSQIWRRFICLL